MFCKNFITTDGRVIDTGNGNVSHSEGQGYGLIFSTYYGDEQKFKSILAWTQQTLRRRRGDTLHAWRFRPDARLPVEDLNNATDGDLLIALGLLRGGQIWNRPELVRQAYLLYMDILHLTTIESEGWLLLLPGVSGFQKSGNVVVNLSYLVFPSLLAALEVVTETDSRQRLHRLINDGIGMIGLAAFGQWKLPPDWLQVSRSSELAPAQGWPPRFSYDAIRIPLYLQWVGMLAPGEQERFRNYWMSFGEDALPAWVDLSTNAQAPYPASPGIRAVADSTGLALPPGMPPRALTSITDDRNYYSASLTLLATIMWKERHPV